MSKDKAEEKANNAQLFLIENKLNDLVISPLWCKDKVYVSDTLMKYTDSLSTENAQLREALREVISRYEILERSVMVHPDYVFGDDNDEWHTFIDCGKEPLNEAKQLLTEIQK